MTARRILRQSALWLTGALSAAIVLFLLAAWIGSAIARNGDWVRPRPGEPGTVQIMIETNGVHTAIVMPLVTEQKDWRREFPASDLPAASYPYTHVSVSWGEREVFLNTPTWSDLSVKTAIGAAFSGDSLLHVAHYIRPAPSGYHRPLTIRREEYALLVERIEAAIPASGPGRPYPGYTVYDVFYDAGGTYHLGNTCNQWTSDTLAAAGIEAGLWTPFAGGVMRWFPASQP